MLRFRPARLAAFFATLLLLFSTPTLLFGWGFWGHQRINRAAILALPDAMRVFFYNHADFITEESVMPDVRKHALGDRNEGPRHYVDVEEFGRPLDQFPRTPDEALTAFGPAELDKHGRLPWVILELHDKLTKAFREGKKSDILLLSADLGHYLADAHMPLHTSSNHDGQLTGQKGIHALWEARLPEIFGAKYDLEVAAPTVIADPTAEVWRIIASSHAAVDTILAVDKKLRTELGEKGLVEVDEAGAPKKNRFGQPVHSAVYAERLHTALHGMIVRRMRASISATAAFWYTAWVQAGQPDLKALDAAAVTQRNDFPLRDELRRLREQGDLPDLVPMREY
ncbi:MAG: S1/P1 Nuclease [Hymenobacteraceae bacterium]|nr:S1/P1 Nuclease [Hymenobacteraceae bacterium]